jgi:hypothetical protein
MLAKNNVGDYWNSRTLYVLEFLELDITRMVTFLKLN